MNESQYVATLPLKVEQTEIQRIINEWFE